MTKEEKFLNALKDIFVGAPVEGQSGYINLMRVKARYFEQGVFPRLTQDIASALQPFPDFREELFDKLYAFFYRYFSESGSIYFRYTPLHQNVYERVYTDDRDVMLFWKTHMLYYVKTDRLFQNMDVEVDGQRFSFDVSTLQHKQANEKRSLVFEFKEKRDEGALLFTVTYSERGRTTKLDDIRRALHKAGAEVDEDTLVHAFRLFERQSEVDYFINKDARAFLREQFDLWMYQYVFSGQSTWTETRIHQLQTLKDIACKIIDFIAQFEDELVKIWNKPKFVLNSNYVITLDRIADRNVALFARILSHANMAQQVQEWRDLGMVGEDFDLASLWQDDLTGRRLYDRYRYLPLDTKHVKDLELDILALFDHLDQSLDGWLIRSENYQALNTILPKFRERVKCVYIDPPYNAEGSEILYVNNYKSSSWATLLDNRLAVANSFLMTGESALGVAVDDYEVANAVELLRGRFLGSEINTIVVNHHPQGSPKANLSRTHEYLLLVTRTGVDFVRVPRPSDRSDERPFMRSGTGANNYRRGRPKSFYAILVDPSTQLIKGIEQPPDSDDYPVSPTDAGWTRIYPIGGDGSQRVWRKTYTSAVRDLARDSIFCRCATTVPVVYEKVSIDRIRATSNWFDSKYNAGTHGTGLLTSLFGKTGLFLYPKSIHAVQDILDGIVYDDEEAIVLDFFAGSGTTAHAVINLNREDGGQRKYILVEMADYFDTVILPRVKKVAFSDKWKDGKAQEGGKGIGHFVKYYHLEQYEDALRHARYEDADLFNNPYQDPYSSYVFLRDTKMLDNAANGERVVDVDVAREKVTVDLSKLYDGIDLAETLSCVTGKWIRRVTAASVEFEDGERVDLRNPDWNLIKSLIWW